MFAANYIAIFTIMTKKQLSVLSIPVIVGALGFFVDIYDLLLFSIVRKPSLESFHLSPEAVLSQGEWIISLQMLGLMLGGFFWGVMGDKKGRLSALFGSIVLYSLATIANGMAQNVFQYSIARFVAGLGLAGELGASITLVCEMLPKEKRGIASSVIASVGVLGAISAFIVYKLFNDWRICYYIGGGMGLLLLFLRMGVFESSMYNELSDQNIQKGNIWMLFNNKSRFFRYMKGVAIGLPVWYVIGILITFSDKFGKELGVTEIIEPGKAILYQYVALCFGDLSAGILSNIIKSRKKTLFIFYGILSFFILLYFTMQNGTADRMYWLCAGVGFGSGISVLYITMSAEQFGTNLRATTAISIPNVVRGILPLIIILFKAIRTGIGDYITGGWITGILIMLVAIAAAFYTKETFGREMNYVEE